MWGFNDRMPSAGRGVRIQRACVAGIVLNLVTIVTGCTQEMANQPRHEPLERSALAGEVFPPRGPQPGTVARGHKWADEEFATGRVDGQFTNRLPQALSDYFTERELLLRGRERFNIYCSHCHGLFGGGDGGDAALRSQVGMVVLRGFPTPPTYHQPRLRDVPLGHLFEVITYGKGRMPAHGYLIPPEDRWAIAAYVKVLQLSQHTPRELLSPSDLVQLERSPPRSVPATARGADDE
jgi:mono/diheme cytochrome c family protein